MEEKLQRRKYSRMQVVQPAVLGSKLVRELPGQIRDFSAGGVLFVFDDSTPVLPLANQFVTLSFVAEQGGTHQIAGRVAHVNERMIGIQITDFPQAAMRALVTETEFGEFVTDGIQVHYSEAQRQTALQDCAVAFQVVMADVVDRFYQLYEQRLERDSEGASAIVQEQMMMRQLRPVLAHDRARISAIWQAGYEQRVQKAGLGEREQRKPVELALVEHDTFDDWLAVTQAVNRLEQVHAAQVARMELRYFRLIDHDVNDLINPYSPHAILWMLHDEIDSSLPSQALKLLVYDLFAIALSERLEKLYESMLKSLAFVDPVKRKPPAHASTAPVAPASGPDWHAETASSTVAANPQPISIPEQKQLSHIEDFLAGRTRSPGLEEEMDVPDWLASVGAPDSLQAALAVQDFGLTQYLWQFNWLNKNAGEKTDLQKIESLAGLSLKSGVEITSNTMCDVLLLADESAPMPPIQPHPPCAQEQLLRLAESAEERMVGITPARLDAQTRERLLGQLGRGIENPLCHAAVLARFFALEQLFDYLGTGEAAGSHLAGLLLRLKSSVEFDCFRAPAGLFSRDSSLLRLFQLLERMMLVADDEGHVLDDRLLKLLDLLVNTAIANYGQDPHDYCNRLLENLLAVVSHWRKLRAATLTEMGGRLAEPGHDNLSGFPPAVLSEVAGVHRGDWLSLPVPGGRSYWQVLVAGSPGHVWLLTNASTTRVVVFSHQRVCSQWELGQLLPEPRFREPLLRRWLEVLA